MHLRTSNISPAHLEYIDWKGNLPRADACTACHWQLQKGMAQVPEHGIKQETHLAALWPLSAAACGLRPASWQLPALLLHLQRPPHPHHLLLLPQSSHRCGNAASRRLSLSWRLAACPASPAAGSAPQTAACWCPLLYQPGRVVRKWNL